LQCVSSSSTCIKMSGVLLGSLFPGTDGNVLQGIAVYKCAAVRCSVVHCDAV